MVRSERESTNEIARFWVLKLPIPAISNASASEKQTPAQSLRGLFTDDSLLFWGTAAPRSALLNRQRPEPKTFTRAEREARKAFAAQEAEKALSEYEKAQRAFHANRERLKAERLAREAAASKTSSLQDS
jgi:hypothetical protein